MNFAIRKYLENYSEAKAWPTTDDFVWDEILILPARRETKQISRLLESLESCQKGKLLVVLLANSCSDAPDSEFEINRKLIHYLFENSETKWIKDRFSLHRHRDFHILLADYASGRERAFPLKQGVGLARKLAADYALRLYEDGQLKSPWVFSTDCDVILPPDYFQIEDLDVSAYHYRFSHFSKDPFLQTAVELYEIYLRYHRLGLKFADCAYSFHTIGSCLAVHLDKYAHVRGFPKREAGEDFYLLNKLAKLGEIKWATPRIQIEGRNTVRTPFGTSKALSKIVESSEYLVYDPRLYLELQMILKALKRDEPDSKIQAELGTNAWKSIAELVDRRVFSRLMSSAQNQKQTEHLFMQQIDGFRILKWLQFRSRSELPKVPWPRAIAESRFLSGLKAEVPSETLRELKILDESTCF